MVELEIENAEASLWEEGIKYYIDIDEETILNCFRHYEKENHREARMEGDGFIVEWDTTKSFLSITHFWADNIDGSSLLQLFEKFGNTISSKTYLTIWIGTETGKEQTKQFLKKNGFNDIRLDETDAFGETFHAKKNYKSS